MLILGTPSKSSARQNRTQNRPSGTKRLKTSISRSSCSALFFRSCLFYALWSPFGSLVVPFWHLWVAIGALLQDVQWLFAARFCQCLAKKSLPPNCQHPKVTAVATTLQWDPKSTKWLPKSSLFTFMGGFVFRSWFTYACCSPYGSLLVPFWFQPPPFSFTCCIMSNAFHVVSTGLQNERYSDFVVCFYSFGSVSGVWGVSMSLCPKTSKSMFVHSTCSIVVTTYIS